jgi:hypothetical protein
MARCTASLRQFVRNMPSSRIRTHIAWGRDTIRQPTYYGPHLVNGQQGPDYIYCARSIAVMRAELRQRHEVVS